jgi:Conidiation protein 6
MHNPNVSAEAKEHSRQVVEELQGPGVVHDDGTTEPSPGSDAGDKNENRVLGGYKATLKSLSSPLGYGRVNASSSSTLPCRS